jgi:hypothetical protein
VSHGKRVVCGRRTELPGAKTDHRATNSIASAGRQTAAPGKVRIPRPPGRGVQAGLEFERREDKFRDVNVVKIVNHALALREREVFGVTGLM